MTRRTAVPESDRFPTRDYDLVKEFVLALVVVVGLTLGLAALFSSPDEKSLTVQGWARSSPSDFVATAVSELDGTSGVATYGPPYNPGDGQKLGPLDLARWSGVRHRIDTATAFVIGPLRHAPVDPALAAALARWTGASDGRRQAWTTAYSAGLDQLGGGDPVTLTAGGYGPVPVLMNRLLALGRAGTLDGLLVAESGYFTTDYTLPLLFLADGSYLADTAQAQHLGGDQWGMMNETGSYPGQAWLWLYTAWYQVSPFNTSGNADALVWGLMMVLTLLFVAVPFLPGLRSLPRVIPVHRLVWRDYSRTQDRAERSRRT